MEPVQSREPWNKGTLVGQKPPLKLKDIWAIRIHLQLDQRIRDLALFKLAVDSKLRGCDLVSISTPLARGRCTERNIDALPTTCATATDRCRRDLRYKVNGSVEMTDPALVRAISEPAHEHSPGFVGDIGECSDAHPVCEIESNSTFPMAQPFVDNFGANDGNAHAR